MKIPQFVSAVNNNNQRSQGRWFLPLLILAIIFGVNVFWAPKAQALFGNGATAALKNATEQLATAKAKLAEEKEYLKACQTELGKMEKEVAKVQSFMTCLGIGLSLKCTGPGILVTQLAQAQAKLAEGQAECARNNALYIAAENAHTAAQIAWKEAKERAEQSTWQFVAATAFKQAIYRFSQQFAYDTATWVGSGGQGQKPLYVSEGVGPYLQNAADSVAGEFIDKFIKGTTGLNICQPNLNITLGIALGIKPGKRPDNYDCSISKLVNRWETAIQNANLAVDLRDYYKEGHNDVSTFLVVQSSLLEQQNQAKVNAALDFSKNEGFKDLKNQIGQILTPGSFIKNTYFKSVEGADKGQETYTGTLADFVETFMNTLVGKMVQTYVTGFFKFSVSDLSGGGEVGFNNYGVYNPEAQSNNSSAQAAKDQFKNFVTNQFKSGGVYNIINKLAVCPEGTNYKPGPTECVIDEDLALAIRQKTLVKDLPASIKSRVFAPRVETSTNLKSVISLRSIIILRTHRIVPVGWEIAANYIKEHADKDYTLGELINAFNNKTSEFKDLIDPYWVLKAPELFCRREGFGPNLTKTQGNEIDRINYCADEQQCIKEGPDGNCLAYGYCTEEKRKWDFQGTTCDAKYNTCQTYTSRLGATAAYLTDTLDGRYCNAQNAGCRWYSADLNPVSNYWSHLDPRNKLNVCNTATGCQVLVSDAVFYGHNVSDKGQILMTNKCADRNGCNFTGVTCNIPKGGNRCQVNQCLGQTNLMSNFNNDFSTCNNWDANLWQEGFIDANNRYSCEAGGRTNNALHLYAGGVVSSLSSSLAVNSLALNSQYSLSFYARGSVNAGSIKVEVLANNVSLANLNLFSGNINANWTQYSLPFSVQGSGTVTIKITSQDSTQASVYFDDFSINSIDANCTSGSVWLSSDGSVPENNKDIFFDRDAQACDASAEGCHQFIRLAPDLGSNLIKNPGFEMAGSAPFAFAGWAGFQENDVSNNSIVVDETSADRVHSGQHSMKLNDSGTTNNYGRAADMFTVKSGRSYILSGWAYRPAPPPGSPFTDTIELILWNQDVANDVLIGKSMSYDNNQAGQWQHLEVVIKPSFDTDVAAIRLAVSDNPNGDVWFDDIKFEEVSYNVTRASAYTGYNPSERPSNQLANLKMAPDYYACYKTGAGTWPNSQVSLATVLTGRNSACSNYSGVCIAEEVGCELYSPENNDPAIPAKISQNDVCPNECVGYQIYKQEETNFVASTYVGFIADSKARYCSAGDAGCDEFTNLDEVAKGGEGRENYSQTQTCQKPDNATEANYYTWEGSDTTGYQLKVYKFKISQAGSIDLSAPCTNLQYNQIGTVPEGQNYCNDVTNAASLPTLLTDAIAQADLDDDTLDNNSVGSLSTYLEYLRVNNISNYATLNQSISDSLHDYGICTRQESRGYFYLSEKWQLGIAGSGISTLSNSGLSVGLVYKATIVVDNKISNIEIMPTAPLTVQQVITEINTDLTAAGGDAVASWESAVTFGYIVIKPNIINSRGVTVIISDNNLFASLVQSQPTPIDTYVAVAANPDCREFYDVSGTVSYRLLSKTVSISEDCHPYRRTQTQSESKSVSCPALGVGSVVQQAQCDCVTKNGFWNHNNECIYMIIPKQGTMCSAAAVGCREYTGNQGNNVRNIISDDFESGLVGWAGGVLSTESSYPGGNSIKSAGSLKKEITLHRNKSYYLSFWAKGDADFELMSAKFSDATDIKDYFSNKNITNGNLSVAPVAVTTSWQRYDLGPVFMVWADDGPQDLVINTGGQNIYIDNTILKETQNNLFVIENSWFTPFSCDNKLDNADGLKTDLASPTCSSGDAQDSRRCWQGEMLGCNAYSDRAGQDFSLKSFEYLCRAEAVGCEALIDTRNSDSPFAQTFNNLSTDVCTLANVCQSGTCACQANGVNVCNVVAGQNSCLFNNTTDDITVPVDENVYMVNDVKFACNKADMGCTAYGLPKINSNDEVVNYQTVYLKNQPDRYDTDLCRNNELWCEEYSKAGGKAYFKSPGDKICEYRDQNGALGAGWYQKDSDESCTSSPYQTIGAGVLADKIQPIGWFDNISGNTNTSYSGWVGSCPLNQSACTEYIDPLTNFYGNLLGNDDFEQHVNNNNLPDDWTLSGGATYEGSDGDRYISVTSAGGATQNLQLSTHTMYTVSAEAEQDARIEIICAPPSLTHETILWSPDRSMERITHYHLIMSRSVNPAGGEISGRFYVEDPVSCNIVVASTQRIDKIKLIHSGVYYYLSSGVDYTSCNGTVDTNGGCILFNDRSKINYSEGDINKRFRDNYLTFDADKTYWQYLIDNKPQSPAGVVVPPDNSQQRNSDSVIKVQPDRDCSKWLYCNSYIKGEEKTPSNTFGNSDECFSFGLCTSINEKGECIELLPVTNEITETYTLADVNKTGYSLLGYDNPDPVKVGKNIKGYGEYQTMDQIGGSTNIANGSFEIVYNDSSEPLGWTIANRSTSDIKWGDYKFSVVIDSSSQRESAGYLRLNSAYEIVSSFVEVEPNKDYYISLWINTLDLHPASARAEALVKEFKADGTANNFAQNCQPGFNGCRQVYALKNTVGAPDYNWQAWDGLTLEAGLPWRRLQQKIHTSPETAQIKIRLVNWSSDQAYSDCNDNDEATLCNVFGFAGFDEIDVKPVLQVRDDGTPPETDDLLARSCRLYPEQGSSGCVYIKNGSLYYGWYGYCLVRDPQNPAVCLQWWPVDRIKGDDLDEAAVGYGDKIPAFYCADAKPTMQIGSEIINAMKDIKHNAGGQESCGGDCGSNKNYVTYLKFDAAGKWKRCITKPLSEYTDEEINALKSKVVDGYECGQHIDTKGPNFILPGFFSISCSCHSETFGSGSSSGSFKFTRIPDIETDDYDYFYIDKPTPLPPEFPNEKYSYAFYLPIKVVLWGKRYVSDDNSTFDPVAPRETAYDKRAGRKPIDYCERILETVDAIGSNKAWSARLSQGSGYTVPCIDLITGYPNVICRHESDSPPFGSIDNPQPSHSPQQWVLNDPRIDSFSSVFPLLAHLRSSAVGEVGYTYLLSNYVSAGTPMCSGFSCSLDGKTCSATTKCDIMGDCKKSKVCSGIGLKSEEYKVGATTYTESICTTDSDCRIQTTDCVAGICADRTLNAGNSCALSTLSRDCWSVGCVNNVCEGGGRDGLACAPLPIPDPNDPEGDQDCWGSISPNLATCGNPPSGFPNTCTITGDACTTIITNSSQCPATDNICTGTCSGSAPEVNGSTCSIPGDCLINTSDPLFYEKTKENLTTLFAKGYSSWSWSWGDGTCATSTNALPLPSIANCNITGDPCDTVNNPSCPANGNCVPRGKCVSGSKAGWFCSNNTDCDFDKSCVQAGSGKVCADNTDQPKKQCNVNADCWSNFVPSNCNLVAGSNVCSNDPFKSCTVQAGNSSECPIAVNQCQGWCTDNSGRRCAVDKDCKYGWSYINVSDSYGSLWNVPKTACLDKATGVLTQDRSKVAPPPTLGSYCYISPEVQKITLNCDDVAGAVCPTDYPLNNNGVIKLGFNVFVDPDQLPIKSYDVNWGDGQSNSVAGVSLRSRTNTENKFNLYHLYDYWTLRNVNRVNVDDSIFCSNDADAPAGMGPDECWTKINIRVKDNWGYPIYNGTFTGWYSGYIKIKK